MAGLNSAIDFTCRRGLSDGPDRAEGSTSPLAWDLLKPRSIDDAGSRHVQRGLTGASAASKPLEASACTAECGASLIAKPQQIRRRLPSGGSSHVTIATSFTPSYPPSRLRP